MSIQNILTPINNTEAPVIDNTMLQGGVTLTRLVNSGDNLLLGSCCSAKVEFNVLDFDGKLESLTGVELRYERDGVCEGYFTVDTAEKQSSVCWKITAYDRMMLFERAVDEMLLELSEEFTLSELYERLCEYIGVEAETLEITNADFTVKKNFSGSDITGRDVLYWIAESAGSYAVINKDGKAELGFYDTANKKTFQNNRYFTYTGSDFCTQPINKVQIHKNENDIGCIVATEDASADGAIINAYCIQDNPLFYTDDGDSLAAPATAILEKIAGFSYVPFECEILADSEFPNVGDFITIITNNGAEVNTVVMESTLCGVKMTVSASGSNEVNNLESKNITIKAINNRTNELARTLESTISLLTQTVTSEEFENKIETLSNKITQTAEDLKIEISTEIEAVKDEQDSIKETVDNGVSKVKTTTVTIDSAGIEVGTSESEIHTKMTPDSFQILQGEENRINVSPEGTRLQKTIIEDDLTVGTVKMIDRVSGIDFVVLEEN